MNIQKINRNAAAFVFDNIESYITNIFLIECEAKVFLIDTFCGPESMAPILNLLNGKPDNKEIVVINTHFHWDHVWGNCSFKKNNIISHEMCRELLDKEWEAQVNKNGRYMTGLVEKHLPNITFSEKIIFHHEGIELFHSPGHTADSISVFDHNEKTLYVGDNMEKPIIYVESPDIDTYIHTLEGYLNYKPEKFVAGHTLHLTEEDLFNTIEYLRGLQAGREMHFETEYARAIHTQNLCTINNNLYGG